jgi:uncharacterized protein
MQRRALVLDPLSVWWGLKSGADGKSPGFPILVFSGPHADIPLHDAAGPVIGELIVTSGISAVLDMGQMRKAEQERLVADLLGCLFTHYRDPLTLVLEEADAFAPQQPMGELTRVLGEVGRIARRGRNFGFRLISITQRPAKLNKYVLTQLFFLASGAGVLRIGVADDAASMVTAGKYNGRQWRSFSQSERLPFVVGIHEGLQE